MTDVAATGKRVETLLDTLTALEPRAAAVAEELVRALTELYGAGLTRALALLGPDDVRRLAADPLLGSLLVLHDLHPDSVETRIKAALSADMGDAELAGLDDSAGGLVANVRVTSGAKGCGSSPDTSRAGIEHAVMSAAPEVDAVRIEAVERPREPVLLQIAPIGRAR